MKRSEEVGDAVGCGSEGSSTCCRGRRGAAILLTRWQRSEKGFDIVGVIGGFVVAGSGQRRRGRGSRGEIGSSARSESMAGAWMMVVTIGVEEDEEEL